ncbi:MAG: hypothetical protein IPO60_14645 [Flavobacteriales bacterium]|nr:hypothetical protein [Flavobacteriales bacterium]
MARTMRYTLVNSFTLQTYPDTLLPDLTLLPARDSRSGLRQAERHLRKRADRVYVAKVSTYVALPEALNDIAASRAGTWGVMGAQGKAAPS